MGFSQASSVREGEKGAAVDGFRGLCDLYTPHFALRDFRLFYVLRVEVGMSSRRFRSVVH